MSKCLFGLTMNSQDPNEVEPVMTYSAFMYILQKVAAEDTDFRTSFEADPEGTMQAANHDFALSRYDYSSSIQLPTSVEAQAILQEYLADYEADQKAGMGGSQHLADPISSRINSSST